MIRTREVCIAKQLSNAERKGYSSRKVVERSKRNVTRRFVTFNWKNEDR